MLFIRYQISNIKYKQNWVKAYFSFVIGICVKNALTHRFVYISETRTETNPLIIWFRSRATFNISQSDCFYHFSHFLETFYLLPVTSKPFDFHPINSVWFQITSIIWTTNILFLESACWALGHRKYSTRK